MTCWNCGPAGTELIPLCDDCKAERAERIARETAEAIERKKQEALERSQAENIYARSLRDADGIDACRRAVEWSRSNRGWEER